MGALRDRMTDEMILRGFSEATVKSYIGTMGDLSRFLQKSLLRVTEQDIKAYFLYLLKERRLSFSAVLLAGAAVKFFLRTTGRESLESSIPKIKRPEQVAAVLNQSELQRFFDALDDLRKRAIFTVIYSAGLRVGELCRLELKDVDFERRQILIRGGKGRKDRYTVLFDETREILREYIAQYRPAGYVFYPKKRPCSPLPARRVEAMFVETREKAGIRPGVCVHTLRHTFATNLLGNGVNVFTIQRLMGHSSLNTTMRYFHLRETAFSVIPSPMKDCVLKQESLRDHDQIGLCFTTDGIPLR